MSWGLCQTTRALYIIGILPLALEGAEFIICEEEERMELRLEDEGLGWKRETSLVLHKCYIRLSTQ